jgi:hypothetical protein
MGPIRTFSMRSRDGRRSVTADYLTFNDYWTLNFSKRTATRSESRSGRAKTKRDAVAQAKAWIKG